MTGSLLLFVAAAFAPQDTWALMEELRATRSYANGVIAFEIRWSDATRPAERVGTYVFHGDDAIWSERDPADARAVVVMPVPSMVRARIGPFQVHNSGHSMQSLVSQSGYDFDTPIADWRQIGLYPDITALELGDHRFLRRLVEDGPPRLERDGDRNLIRTRLITADARLVFWQDPARGNHVVRSQLWHGDFMMRECRVDLQKIDRDWFPRQVRYYSGNEDESEPTLEADVRITRASLDQPDAERLTMTDAGVCVGTNVAMIDSEADHDAFGTVRRPMFGWDGHAFVTMRELHEKIVAGVLERSDRFERDRAAFRLSRRLGEFDQFQLRRLEPESTLSAWRAYTLDFARSHNFDQAQQQQALLICSSSEQQAARIVQRFVAREPDLRSASEAAIQAEMLFSGTVETATLEKAMMRRTALDQQIRQVFHKDLRPRLEKLVTRHQQSREQGDDE